MLFQSGGSPDGAWTFSAWVKPTNLDNNFFFSMERSDPVMKLVYEFVKGNGRGMVLH